MQCSTNGCRRQHRENYGSKCEECWADSQPSRSPLNIPGLTGIGEWEPGALHRPDEAERMALAAA